MRLLPLLLVLTLRTAAQSPIAIADQTFKIDGIHEFAYAFAAGDQISLRVQLLMGRSLRAVEFVQWPDNLLFRAYALDTALQKTVTIPATGLYVLRLQENGLGKKVCRFTLHRTPADAATARVETRIGWDWKANPVFQVRQRPVAAGVRTHVVSTGGKVTVVGSKMGLQTPVNAYQFTLPAYTTRWAYRIAVGQAGPEARRQDATQFSEMLKKSSVKMATYQPETALAAFALGMAIDLTKSTSGEDVEYALLTGDNFPKFTRREKYDAYVWQGGISVDAQRRVEPLAGTYFFAFRNNNWVDDVEISVDIEAVTETPVVVQEIYLEPGQ
jgi:hypothetical protein